VAATVTQPKITPADVDALPVEDREYLVAVAFRRRDVDAEGEHYAGLNTSEKWRRFRLRDEFDPALAGL
jgi:hypothetical protein